MVPLSMEKVKDSPGFIEDIRFDMTPKLFVDPKSAPGEPADLSNGYFLYVDFKEKQPVIMVMQMRSIVCRTVAYITDVPEDLLKDALKCHPSNAPQGMYPLGDKLTAWLKKELNIS